MQISEPAEYAILGLLDGQPMYGYEMFQQFQGGHYARSSIWK